VKIKADGSATAEMSRLGVCMPDQAGAFPRWQCPGRARASPKR
jgi:hypothetical protein